MNIDDFANDMATLSLHVRKWKKWLKIVDSWKWDSWQIRYLKGIDKIKFSQSSQKQKNNNDHLN